MQYSLAFNTARYTACREQDNATRRAESSRVNNPRVPIRCQARHDVALDEDAVSALISCRTFTRQICEGWPSRPYLTVKLVALPGFHWVFPSELSVLS